MKFPAIVAAWQTNQPKRSQPAKTKKIYELNSLNFTTFLLLHPVRTTCGGSVFGAPSTMNSIDRPANRRGRDSLVHEDATEHTPRGQGSSQCENELEKYVEAEDFYKDFSA